MTQNTPNRDEILTCLESFKNCKVTFNKIDGTERTLNCTRHESVIPAIVKQTNEDTLSTSNINVWCIDSNSWKSFKIENLIKLEINI